MACYSGPKISKDGLVFHYDMHNFQKSWKGAPITNYYGDMSSSGSMRYPRTTHFWTGKNWIIGNGYTDPGVDGPDGVYLGLVYKHTSGSLSSTWSGNSYGYILKDLASTIGTTYAMSVWTYVSLDCNISALPCITEGATTNNISISGFSGDYSMSAKGTWQRLARGAVSDGNVRWIPVYPRRDGVTDGSFTGFFMWAAPQVEVGTVISRYAGEDIGYSRSNTQSIHDLIKNNTITATSLTYSSDGKFTFNGVDNAIYISNGISYSNGFTFEAMVNPINAGENGYGRILDKTVDTSSSQGVFLYMNAAPLVTFSVNNTGGVSSPLGSVPYNMWTHVCATVTASGSVALYINGKQVASGPTGLPSAITTTNLLTIGNRSAALDRSFFGNIHVVKVYGRPLTALEIQQNFEATRSRYGV